MGRYAWLWVVLAACSHVRTEVTYSQTLINREIKDVVVPASTVIRDAARIDGETVIVALRSEATCRTTTTPIYQRERHLHKVKTGDDTPAQFAPISALVDTVRLRDETEDAGQVRGAPEQRDHACQQHPVSHAAVRARTEWTDWRVETTSDADGEVRLDVHDLAENAWRGSQLSVQLTIDGQRVPIVVDGATALLATLAADASSRVAVDRARRADQACSDEVARLAGDASDPPDDVVAFKRKLEELARQEAEAHASCGDRWTAHDEQIAAFHARVEAMQKALAVREHGVLLASELEARYEQHDAIGLRGVVTRDAQAVEVLRSLDGVGEALVELARYWVARLEAGERGAQAQLCASHALVTRFAGAAAWSRLRAEVAARSNVVAGARLAGAMGSCR